MDCTDHQTATITVRDLTIDHGAGPVVDHLDLDLVPGEMHVLFGPSGAGKSSVLSALSGTLPANANIQGNVLLQTSNQTFDLLNTPTRILRRQVSGRLIGTARQAAGGTFTPTMTLWSQLREAHHGPWAGGRRFGWGHPHRATAAAQHLIDLAAAADIDPSALKLYPHQFSGGQLGRLNTLAALVNHPPVILADEPTTGLDWDTMTVMGELLAGYANAGHTVLVVTHDRHFARRWAHRVTRLSHGRAVGSAPTQDILGPGEPKYQRNRGGAIGDVKLAGRGITVRHQDRTIVAPVDLQIRSGEIVGLTGPSGVGKSSLANVLALIDAPSEGVVTVDGETVMGAGLALAPATRRRVAWLSQNPREAVDPRLTLRQIVELPGRLAGLKVNAAALAEQCGLNVALLDRRPHEVSGGELQRLCLARALGLKPTVLIADEPISMLDDTSSAIVLRLLRSAADAGMGVLHIGHDIHLMESQCDRMLFLRARTHGAVLSTPSEEERNTPSSIHGPRATPLHDRPTASPR